MKKFILLLLILLPCGMLYAQQLRSVEVKITASPAGLMQLASLGLPLEEGFHSKDGTWTIVLSQQEVNRVAAAGIPFEVLHEDYTKFIADRNIKDAGLIGHINRHKQDFNNTDVSNYTIPVHFKLGSMGGYLTLAEVYSELDSMRLLYPNLISAKFSIGNSNSIEGRPLYCVRISNNPNQTQSKPRVFYNSLTHAREPMGMQQFIFYMWYLLENYATSEEIRYLVDNLELYFVPVANPDGYEYNHSYAPNGGGDWRKNRRNNGDGTWGVDLNRNYGYKWGYDNNGSSPNPGDLTYRGTAAFSEPETQIVRDFCIEMGFRIAMNYHTYSNYLLYPWSWQTQISPDSTLQLTYADYFTRQNGYLGGMPGTILYNTNGDSMDWEYGEQTAKPKIIAFTAETGNQTDGFWPPVTRIIPLAQENMYANFMVAHFALRYAEAYDISPVITSEKEGYFKFEFKRFGLDAPANYQVSVQPMDTTLIIATGPPQTISNPAIFQIVTDSISYTLKPDIVAGTEIGFIYRISNGFYTFQDTVIKYYGPPLVVFSDSCNSMDKWTSAKWGVSLTQYHSAPGSITDSPTGNYTANFNFPVSNNNKIDLQNSPVAVLNYYAKWKTEKGFDFVQLLLSDDNGLSWVPKAGRYTVTGTEFEAFRQPVYDGKKYNWVKEQLIMKEFVGKDIRLRFNLKADNSRNYDGFYFDDVTVTIVDMTGVGTGPEAAGQSWISGAMPNPASNQVAITYRLPEAKYPEKNADSQTDAIFELLDLRGVTVMSKRLNDLSGKLTIFVGDLPEGIFLYRIRTSSGTTGVKKLVVIH